MDDMIWQWDGYCIRKRPRAAVEKDIADDEKRGMKRRRYAFDSELAATEHAYRQHVENAERAITTANDAEKLAHKWFLRRKRLKNNIACAARELKRGEIREAE